MALNEETDIDVKKIFSSATNLRLFLSRASRYDVSSVDELQELYKRRAMPVEEVLSRMHKYSDKRVATAMFSSCPSSIRLYKYIKYDELYALYDDEAKEMLVCPGHDYNDWGLLNIGSNIAAAYFDNSNPEIEDKYFLGECVGYLLTKKYGRKVSHEMFPRHSLDGYSAMKPEELKVKLDSILSCCNKLLEQIDNHLVIVDHQKRLEYER